MAKVAGRAGDAKREVRDDYGQLRPLTGNNLVGDTGIEPVTSSV
jgi:hypothetical protein